MRVVIVEDERPARDHLELLLKSELPEHAQLHVFETIAEARSHLDAHPTDLLFLDLDIHGQDGFQLLDGLRGKSFHTVIVSGHIERAIDAFEHGVVDFLAKPATARALIRALDRVAQLDARMVRLIGIETKSQLQLLEPAQVFYIEKKGGHTNFVCRDGKHQSRQSLSKVLAQLPPDFLQVHKGFIANRSHIRSLEAESGGHYGALIVNGETIPVGRSFYKDLKARLSPKGS